MHPFLWRSLAPPPSPPSAATTAILRVKAWGSRAVMASLLAATREACWGRLRHDAHAHPEQYTPAAKQSQYSFRHWLFRQWQVRVAEGCAGAPPPAAAESPRGGREAEEADLGARQGKARQGGWVG